MALTPTAARRVLVPASRSSAPAASAPHVRHFRLARVRLTPRAESGRPSLRSGPAG
jgi:hypothetical protein